jgi:hypothetical protein
MDLSKYPLEKLVYFIAGIIPGFVALLIYGLAVPGSFGWFFALGFLGYKTRISLILLVAFVAGNSLTTLLNAILGSIGATLDRREAKEPYKPPHSYEVAPWRDPRWRTALKNHLGGRAPIDSQLASQQLLSLMREQINNSPEAQRPSALANLEHDRIQAEINDGKWEQWYDHYHRFILFNRGDLDIIWYVRQGLNFNLETAGVYVLISALVVTEVRHWWTILPASIWVLLLVAFEYSEWTRYKNKWSTLSEQTKYLMAQEPLKESPTAK